MIGLEQPIKWCSAYIYGHIVFGPTSCMITSVAGRDLEDLWKWFLPERAIPS